MMKATEYIANFLEAKGINIVFELQGGMITRIIDSIQKHKDIKIVSMHHEQAAAMAVDAYGRISNKPGIALATSGPGATNLLTGIGNCYFDSVPAIFITGQVNLNEQRGDRDIRQLGFQETDIVDMAKAVTKEVFSISSATELPSILEKAYQISLEGRPGPVLIDIPMNTQNEEIQNTEISINNPESPGDHTEIDNFIDRFHTTLNKSQKPLVLIGRGIRASDSVNEFLSFISNYNIPVVTSLLGLDALPYDHPCRIGFIGTYGNRWANYALGSCDLLLVLGSRLDLRQTGTDTLDFQKGKEIFHVDIEAGELNNRLSDCTILETSLRPFFERINNTNKTFNVWSEWVKEIQNVKMRRTDIQELDGIKGINPNSFLHELSQASSEAKVFISDVGNNQMWCAQSLEISSEQQFLTSGGMGAMGYSLPAAIGASITLNNAPVIAISGDGGFQINIQELQTIRRNNLPVKIVILNNHCLGMIRQFQDSYFDSCYQSTVWGYSAPDFSSVANAYGIDSFSIESPQEIKKGIEKLWERPDKPFLLNVSIDVHTNVFPKMMFGSPITKMESMDS